jgi:hypothetical protein
MDCDNAFASKCEKIRIGAKVYEEAEPIHLSQQKDSLRVIRCNNYVPDRSVVKKKKGKKGAYAD